RAVVVAQIAGVTAGAEVDPLADVGMPQEALVRLVAVTVDDAALDLAADAAVRPETAAAHAPGQDVREGPDVTGPFQPAEGLHDGAAVDQHLAVARVDDHLRLDLGRRI